MSESEQKLPEIEKVKTYLNNLNKKYISGLCLFVLLCFWFLSDEDENAIFVENSTQMLKMQRANLEMQQDLLIELQKIRKINFELLPSTKGGILLNDFKEIDEGVERQRGKDHNYYKRNPHLWRFSDEKERKLPDGYGS